MKPFTLKFSSVSCKFVRTTLVWAIFLLGVYLYATEDKNQTQVLRNLDRLEEARRRSSIDSSPNAEATTLLYDDVEEEPHRTLIPYSNTQKNSLKPQSLSYEDIIPETRSATRVGLQATETVKERLDKISTGHGLQQKFNEGDEEIRDDAEETQEDLAESEHLRLNEVRTPQSQAIVSALRVRYPGSNMVKPYKLHWTVYRAGAYPAELFTPPPGELPQQRFPKAIIIGFGKCGTRALVEFLGMHPYIVSPGPEVHFFDVDENFNKGWDWYLAQMPFSYSNQITLEKTPSYIWSQRALDEIYKMDKNMKLIVIIKDPVTRVVSQALRSNMDVRSMSMLERKGELLVNNNTRTVQWSIYVNYLRQWMSKFSRSQIHVVETNQFVRQPARELIKLETFLEIPHVISKQNFYFNKTKGFYCKRPFHTSQIVCLSQGKGRPHPVLEAPVERALYQFFEGYNQELFRLLGRTYEWLPSNHTQTTTVEVESRS